MKIQFLVLHLSVVLSSDQSHRKCIGFGDPHFQAFSGAKFAVRDGCNYALVQRGSWQDPEFGVFMNFHQEGHANSHVGPTVYIEDKTTFVHLDPRNDDTLFNVEVKGNKQEISSEHPTPVIGTTSVKAWKHSAYQEETKHTSSCLRLMGQELIIVELCPTQIAIIITEGVSNPSELRGLCGSYTTNNILIGRYGDTYPDPQCWNDDAATGFTQSWRTNTQTPGKANCKASKKRKRSARLRRSERIHMNCLNVVNKTDTMHHEQCIGVHIGNGGSGDDHHDACKYDLCIAATDPGYKKNNFTVAMMLEEHKEIHHREKIHNDNSIDLFEQLRAMAIQTPQRPHFPLTRTPVSTVPGLPFWIQTPQQPSSPQRPLPVGFTAPGNSGSGSSSLCNCDSIDPLEICCKKKKPLMGETVTPSPPDNQCGIRNIEGFRITHMGTDHETQYGEFPWMVAVGDKGYLGGGSLLHPKVVLTAAHILHNIIGGLVARIGEWDLSTNASEEFNPAQTINVKTIVIHPNFDRYTFINDVALLILESDAILSETVIPICLPEPDQVFDGLQCIVTGWEINEPGESGKFQKVLKKVEVPAVNHNDCQSMLRSTRLGQDFLLHNTFNCAGGEGEDPCDGYGGSPLICPKPNMPNEYVQMGVTAWGIGCGIKGNPGVYGSVPKTVEWIHHVINKEG